MSEKRRPIGAIMVQRKGEKAVKIGALWPATYKDSDDIAPPQLSFNKKDDEYGEAARGHLSAALKGEGFVVLYMNDGAVIELDGEVVAERKRDAAPTAKGKAEEEDDFGLPS